jgi:hypothetical protein
MNKTQNLLNLKEKIEGGKVKRNKLEGQKEETLKILKKEFDCKGIKSGKLLLKKMKQEIETENDILEKQIKKLERSIKCT